MSLHHRRGAGIDARDHRHDVGHAHVGTHHRHLHRRVAERRHAQLRVLEQQRQAVEREEQRHVEAHRRRGRGQDHRRVRPVERALGHDDGHALGAGVVGHGRNPRSIDRVFGRGAKLAEKSLLAKSNKLGSRHAGYVFPAGTSAAAQQAVQPSRVAAPLFVASEFCRRPGFGRHHPLSIPRVSAVLELCEQLGWLDERCYRDSPAASVAELTRFHDPDYVEALQRSDAAGRVEPASARAVRLRQLRESAVPGRVRACGDGGRRLDPRGRARARGPRRVPSGRRHAPWPARPRERLLLFQRPGVRDSAPARRWCRPGALRRPRRAPRRRRAGRLPRRAAGAHRLDPRARPLAAQRRSGRHGPRLRTQPAGAGRVQRQRAGLPDGRGGVAAGRGGSTRRRWSSPAAPMRWPATRCRAWR